MLLLIKEEFFVNTERVLSSHTESRKSNPLTLLFQAICACFDKASRPNVEQATDSSNPHNNHRISNFIDYCFHQVLTSNLKQPLTVLKHLLKSIEEEENMRCSRLVYEVDPQSSQPDINWTDTSNPSQTMREICLRSIAKGMPQEIDRFKLEFKQWQRVAAITGEIVPQLNSLLVDRSIYQIETSLVSILKRSGFQLATEEQLALLYSHLEQERGDQASPKRSVWAGIPQAYCMPPSKIHGGKTSVIAIAQPFFDLSGHRLFILQTQVLAEASINELMRFFLKHTSFETSHSIHNASLLEKSLMESILKVGDPFTDHLRQICLIIEAMDATLPESLLNPANLEQVEQYTQLLFDLLTYCETAADDSKVKQLLAEFFYEVIFKGLKNPDFALDQQTSKKIFEIYRQKIYHAQQSIAQSSPKEKPQLALLNVGFKPAGTNPISISQCVLGGVINNPQLKQVSRLAGIKPQKLFSLNKTELAGVVGEHEASKYKRGVCQMCGARGLVKNGLCYGCLLASGQMTVKDGTQPEKYRGLRLNQPTFSRSSSANSSLPRVSLQDVINGRDTVIVNSNRAKLTN